MRVLLVGRGDSGGIGRYEQILAQALTELGQEGDLELHSAWRCQHPSYLGTVGGNSHYPKGKATISRFVFDTLRLAGRVRPSVVVFTTINLARLLLVSRGLLDSSRAVVCIHGKEAWHPVRGLKRAALHSTGQVVVTTSYTQEKLLSLQRLDAQRIAKVPLTLEPSWLEAACTVAQSPPAVAQTPRLLTVTRLASGDQYKGVDVVIRALPQIVAAVPGVRYRVVGGGDDLPRLRSLSAMLGVDESVDFLGNVSAERLLREYSDCDLFVLPSKREGFGLVFLEAMAFSKPVIASAAAGAVDVVDDGQTGILLERDEHLADAVVELLADAEQRARLGDEGYSRLTTHFSFQAYMERWSALLAGFHL